MSGDVLDALYRQWFQMEVEAEERQRLRPGDDGHPINVETIKQGLGCLPICEVEIDFVPMTEHYAIRHRTPAHRRTYTVLDRWGFVTREEEQTFAQDRQSQISIDPYLLNRYGDADDIARQIIKQMRYEWNQSWPHHA